MRDKRTLYYRYVSRAELKFILRNFYIMSRSGITYFTYERYDDANRAQERLALERRPEYRIGPIPEEEMPFIPYKGVVPPTPPFPGGAPEIYITEPLFLVPTLDPVYLLGIYEFNPRGSGGVFIKPCCEIVMDGEALVKRFREASRMVEKALEWEAVRARYDRIERRLREIAGKWNLTLRPFPWDRMEVDLVGRAFLINIRLGDEPYVVSLRTWRGEEVREERVEKARDVDEIPLVVEEILSSFLSR